MKIGIDVGSTAIKIVFVDSEEVIWKRAEPTRPGQPKVVGQLIREGMQRCSLAENDIQKICATGYGRNLIKDTTGTIDELSANAAGIYRLSSGKARSVINIGGQDVKVIKLNDDGGILDFRMNDKCAAGTGRFFEIAARILDTPI